MLDRAPHFIASAMLWAALEEGRAHGLVSAHAVTTIHYVLARNRGELYAARSIPKMVHLFKVATVDDGIIRSAMKAAYGAVAGDFEDAVTAAAAEAARCNLIVTRDPKGFRHSPVLAMGPEEALRLLSV